MALGQGAVNYLCGALHLAGLVGVLNAQDERALAVPGDEPGVQGGAQVAHVHIAGGRGAKRVRTFPLGILASISSKYVMSSAILFPSIPALCAGFFLV